jgi:hypothetical protein
VIAAASPVPSPLIPTVAASVNPDRNLPTGNSKALLSALKDELFSLETERLEGRLSDTDYAEIKSALEVVLRRALARQNA